MVVAHTWVGPTPSGRSVLLGSVLADHALALAAAVLAVALAARAALQGVALVADGAVLDQVLAGLLVHGVGPHAAAAAVLLEAAIAGQAGAEVLGALAAVGVDV